MQIFVSATEKRLFGREFWVLFGAGVFADAILVVISHLPTTPVAMFLFVKYNPPEPEMLGIAAAEILINLTIIVGFGLLAARAMGFGVPILEKWLRGSPDRVNYALVLSVGHCLDFDESYASCCECGFPGVIVDLHPSQNNRVCDYLSCLAIHIRQTDVRCARRNFVPAPTIISGMPRVRPVITSIASGTVIVISAMGMPPRLTASAANRASCLG